jgi:hypothetical protein
LDRTPEVEVELSIRLWKQSFDIECTAMLLAGTVRETSNNARSTAYLIDARIHVDKYATKLTPNLHPGYLKERLIYWL